jgi:hypothetical protein
VVVDGVARATAGSTGGGAGDLVLLARHDFFVCETERGFMEVFGGAWFRGGRGSWVK